VQVVDGSLFRVAGEVAWALRRRSPGSATRHEHFVRLDLQLCVARGVPVEVQVSGKGDGEVAVALRKVQGPGVTYVADRGIFSFAYLQRILDTGSDFVLRIRATQKFTVTRELPLTEADKAAGVVSDRSGTLSGDRYRPAPAATLREVIVLDPLTGKPVRLLTSLPQDVPAHVIGAIYRHRWQIELFFRWLKVHARFRHLISHNANGLHLGFYVAVIAVLLIYLHSGKKPGLYAYNMLSAVAMGWATVADILPVLERREHERQRDRKRQSKRRPEKTVK
jgi:IS4 transposase